MITINKDTKIYILCPAYSKTGGPELLHQLAYNLKLFDYDACIAYYGINDNKNYTPKDFEKYIINDIVTEDDIVDNSDNIIIFPEIYIKKSKKYKYARKCLWWLSVDNFLKTHRFKNCFCSKGIKETIIRLIRGDFFGIKISSFDFHLCQSYYAIDFLKKNGIENSYYLSDYINSAFFKQSDKEKKENVLYNPKKGYKFTKKIIDNASHLNWIPIKGLTTDQVHDLLSTSKVYIDFGNHPGKDRFPREAAISGCCVITSKNGSAAYYEDVPISDDYKFNCKDENINKIIQKIEQCLNNYENEIKNFDEYRKKIKSEEDNFKKDILKLFIKNV